MSNFYNEDSLSSYVSEIKNFPILGQDEEFELATRWKEKGDKKALDKLIKSHLRLVTKIARGYSGYGLSQSDLIAEGNVGIMHAIQHFDPKIGYRFSTYAAWWIKSKINNFVYNFWSMVKMPDSKNNRKLFFGLRKIKSVLGLDTVSDHDAGIIADKLQVDKEDVLTSDRRFTNKDFSVDTPMGEGGTSTLKDFLADTTQSQEEIMFEKQEYNYRKKVLHDALSTLTKREYDIVSAYRLKNPTKTLREISTYMNISAERVRQIEVSAFLKIQKYVRNIEWKSSNPSNGTYHRVAHCFMNVLCQFS